jgi:hypothetical protein
MALTGKTIGQLTYLSGVTTDTLFPVELSGDTYHISYSAFTNSNYNEGTYDNLYSFATGGTLTAGSYYLMIDFQTCYDQPNYDNTKNPITTGNYKTGTTEPILLLAISTTGFSPTVYSTLYPQDKITYDITWNTTEITSSPAKGRITERIDEFNNRTDYDHRTILFKRYRGYSYNENSPLSGLIGISGITGTTGVLYGNTGTTFNSNISSGSIIAIPNLNPAFFEVISVESDSLAIISGVTISGTDNTPYYSASDDGIMSYYQPNIRQNQVYEYTTFGDALDVSSAINNYIGNQANLYLDDNSGQFLLANNVFLDGSFLNNTIGNGSYNNTFNDDCDSNQIGDRFYNNSTNDDFDGNIIGDFFNNNYITSNFNNNRIGSDFDSNILLGGSFYRNNIGNDFANNVWTNGDFQNNEIGNQFNNNNIYDDFYNNDIGNGYNNNESYFQFYRNLIGNGYNDNTIYSSFYENNIEHVFENNTIGTDLVTYDFFRNMIGSGFNNNEITNNFYGNEIGYDFNNNSISGETYTNRIGEQFENNTIYGDFYDNQIFNEFKGNMMYGEFNNNKVDWGFGSNQFSGDCGGNSFGPLIVSNDFLGDVYGNVIKGDFYNNTIGDGFGTNNIGSGFYDNTIAQNFANNEIGNFFTNNTIDEGFGFGGSSTQKNYIGDEFYNNTVGEYFYNNRVGNYFRNNTLGDYFQWNVIDTNIDNTDFTPNYGNITGFSYTATGTSATDNIYTGLTGTTNGVGVNASFDVEVSGNAVIGVSGNTTGNSYNTGDTITILGTDIGGYSNSIDSISDDGVGKNGSDGTYNDLPVTGGTGTNATFDVSVSSGLVDGVLINNRGNGYEINDELTIIGSLFGGTDGVDDITITVTAIFDDDVIITVTSLGTTPSVYEHYTCQIFERQGGDKRLSYYDSSDILTIKNINE